MKVKINKGKAKGFVKAPPSKSMAHRLLICAGLSEKECVVHGISESEDVLATLDCLTTIGVKWQRKEDTITVQGVDITKISAESILNCRESGSTLRFFVPICLVSGANAVLSGSERLMERPMGIYENLCKEKGMIFSKDKTTLMVKGPLKPGNFKMAGNVSSQFISGLLFVLPLLSKDSTLTITPPIESRSYIDMTMAALAQFGVETVWQDENTIYIKGNQKYSADEAYVEGDYLSPSSIQGDRVYSKMFEQLKEGTPILNISGCPDLGPILFAVSAAVNGGVFSGTSRLKIKESDRGQVMAEELKKFGVSASLYDDEIIIYPTKFERPKEALYGHNDHRIVMSEAVLLTLTGGIIDGAEAVTKSFPDFFEKLASLGIEVEKIED